MVNHNEIMSSNRQTITIARADICRTEYFEGSLALVFYEAIFYHGQRFSATYFDVFWSEFRNRVELEFDEGEGVLHVTDSVVHRLHLFVHFSGEVVQETVNRCGGMLIWGWGLSISCTDVHGQVSYQLVKSTSKLVFKTIWISESDTINIEHVNESWGFSTIVQGICNCRRNIDSTCLKRTRQKFHASTSPRLQPSLAVRAMKWLTKVTSRFFWMASTRVRSIEAAVTEFMMSGAVDDTVEPHRRFDEDDIAAIISLRLSHYLLSFESLNIFPLLAHYLTFDTDMLHLVLFIQSFQCLPLYSNKFLEFRGLWSQLCNI